MIKLIENYEPELFEKIAVGEELSACLISTLYELYLSDTKTALFWKVLAENGSANAIIALFNGCLHIVKISDTLSEYQEIADFISLVAPNAAVEGSENTLKGLLPFFSGHSLHTRTVLVRALPALPRSRDSEISRNIKLDDMYFLLCKCFRGFGSKGGRGVWMTDTSLRLRKRDGAMYGIFEGGTLISGCGTYSRCGRFQVISGVATLPQYRSLGYAGSLVNRAAMDIFSAGRIPIICAADDRALSLYKKLGFEEFSSYSTLKHTDS